MRIHTEDSEIALAKLKDAIDFKPLGRVNVPAKSAGAEELFLIIYTLLVA